MKSGISDLLFRSPVSSFVRRQSEQVKEKEEHG